MTYYYLFKTFRRLTGSNHLAFGITSNLCTCIPWYLPQQPRFQADAASNNPVSGAGNKEVNSKIAFFSSACIILHIILTSFNRNNTNATLYNNRVSPLKYYYILFISVYPLDLLQVDLLASGASLVWQRSGRPRAIRRRTFGKSMHPYMCYFADNISQGSCVYQQNFATWGSLSSLLLSHFP